MRAPHGADGQGRERRAEGRLAGRRDVRGSGLDRRHGGAPARRGMGRVFTHAYAPSTWGSFLRSLAFGHVRQLDAVASRFLTRLAAVSRSPPGSGSWRSSIQAAATARPWNTEWNTRTAR